MTPETTETQENGNSQKARRLILVVASFSLVLASLLCCGQVAFLLASSSRTVDTLSLLKADYSPWGYAKVGAINLAGFKEDVQKDQVLDGVVAVVPGDEIIPGIFWPTGIPTPIPVAMVTETASVTPTDLFPEVIATETATVDPTITPTPTVSGGIQEGTATRTPTRTQTRAPSGTPSATPSPTRTYTYVPLPTWTHTSPPPEPSSTTVPPTRTNTVPAATFTYTPTRTNTAQATRTFTPVPTRTNTLRPVTPTFTFTPAPPTFTPTHTKVILPPTWTNTPVTPVATTPPVLVPVFPIPENRDDGEPNGKSDPDPGNPSGCMGYFGYLNGNPQNVIIPEGPNNYLSPGAYEVYTMDPAGPGLPTIFYVDRMSGVVQVKWNSGTPITWVVNGNAATLNWCR